MEAWLQQGYRALLSAINPQRARKGKRGKLYEVAFKIKCADRPCKRSAGQGRRLSRAHLLPRQRRQRHGPLRPELQFKRLAGNPVVHVRLHRADRRILYAAHERTCASGHHLWRDFAAQPHLGGYYRHRAVPVARLLLPRLAFLAHVHPVLASERNVLQCRRSYPLAGEIHHFRRFRSSGSSGFFRTHQAHRALNGFYALDTKYEKPLQ